MNILVIGNGFDLAHELPTKYTDFLGFVKAIKQALGKGKLAGIDWGNTDIGVKNLLIHDKGNVQRNLFSDEQMWKDLINNNIWFDYFLNNPMYKRDNWIDFESEVSNIIQSLDNDMKRNDESLDDSVLQCSNYFLNNRFCSYIDEMKPKMHTYRMIRDELLGGLNKLIRAFEIYLTEYVEKIDIRKKSPNIEKLEIDHVLSFNYTDTYKKVYGISKEIEYDYIHGKADVINTIDSNNMVLGIDEYLENNRKNRDIEFIEFKKYYQRIYKQTGCRYKEWIDEIVREYLVNSKTEEKFEKLMLYAWGRGDMEKFGNFMGLRNLNNDRKIKIHNLYIFGHSLDVTDKDILCDLILNDNVYTTIYYPNKEELGRKITNLVKVIGQDELIRRTGGSTKTIRFELQKDMI